MPDTSLGITYPSSTDHTRIWEHLQTLADDLNALLLKRPEMYTAAITGVSTDASGFVTISHSAGWTPTGGWFTNTAPASSFAVMWGIDSIGASSVRLRLANANGGALASASVTGRLFLIK